MKHQGVMIASVRTYLGVLDGADAWEFSKYIVGIYKEGEKLVDYLTGEEYDAIFRTYDGYLTTSRAKVKVGKVYAVESTYKKLDKKEMYSDRQINSLIRELDIFSEEYKALTKSKGAKILTK